MDVFGFEGGVGGGDGAEDDAALEGFDAEEFILVGWGEGIAVIDEERMGEAFHLVMVHLGEVTEGVGVGEFAVLLEAFLEVGALGVVEAAGIAAVVAGEDSACVIHFYAEGIAATFREDFIAAGFGLVAPDVLSERCDDVGGGG